MRLLVSSLYLGLVGVIYEVTLSSTTKSGHLSDMTGRIPTFI
jgi:hypothetical protein